MSRQALLLRRADLLEQVARVDRELAEIGDSDDVDALVPIGSCGIERAALRRHAREQRLVLVRIGRTTFVRRSALLRLFDLLAAEQKSSPATSPHSYLSIVGRR